MTRIYITIGLIVFAFLGGWKVNSWYEDSKEKIVIEKEVIVFNEQTLKDQDALLKAEIDLDNYREEIDKLKGKAYEIDKGICATVDSHADFNRLYDEAVRAANSTAASKVPD